MPEALEKWPVSVFGALLPRNMEIVERIDAEWLAGVKACVARVRRVPCVCGTRRL